MPCRLPTSELCHAAVLQIAQRTPETEGKINPGYHSAYNRHIHFQWNPAANRSKLGIWNINTSAFNPFRNHTALLGFLIQALAPMQQEIESYIVLVYLICVFNNVDLVFINPSPLNSPLGREYVWQYFLHEPSLIDKPSAFRYEINPSPRNLFPECVAKVPVSFGGVGVRLCSPKVVSVFATVRDRLRESRNRLRVRRKALRNGECVWSVSESVSSWLVVAAVILAFAEEVSVWVICVAAVVLAFVEEVSVWVICVAVVILAFAEGVSVWVICVAAVILAFAEEMSVWVICIAAVILALAEEVSVRAICIAAVISVFAEELSMWVICFAAAIWAFAEEVSVWAICVPEECQVRVSYKSVKPEVSSKSVLKECQVRSVK